MVENSFSSDIGSHLQSGPDPSGACRSILNSFSLHSYVVQRLKPHKIQQPDTAEPILQLRWLRRQASNTSHGNMMAASEITDDYYSILEVPQTATSEVIRKSYLRLAVTLHPDKNPDKPDATASFQCLVSAYETISDTGKRQLYDKEWIRIRHRQNTQQNAKKRQAEAAEIERKRAAEETLNKQREHRVSQERLRQLEQLRSNYDNDIFEINRVIRKLSADLKRLQDQDNEELRKERERNSWLTYFTSSIFGKATETETQERRQTRESERLQRLASRSIKGNELSQKEARLQSLKSVLQDVSSKIAAKLRKEEAVRAAKEARDAQEAREAREAREAQERVRRAQADEELARVARECDAARRRNSSMRSNSSYRAFASNTEATCRHEAFWPRLEGSHLCSNCHTTQRRFAFQCPGCRMIACASCRQSLRGKKGRNDGNSGRRFEYDN